MATFAAGAVPDMRNAPPDPNVQRNKTQALSTQLSDLFIGTGHGTTKTGEVYEFDATTEEDSPWHYKWARKWYIYLGFPEPALHVDLEIVRLYFYYEEKYARELLFPPKQLAVEDSTKPQPQFNNFNNVGVAHSSSKKQKPVKRKDSFMERRLGTKSWTTPQLVSRVGDFFIIISIISVLVQTHPSTLGHIKPLHWLIIDGFIVAYFSVEFVMRFYVCNAFGATRYQFMTKLLNVCDFMAIVPYFATLFGGSKHLEVLKIFRMARLIRLLMSMKIGRLLIATFRVSATALYILIFFIIVSGILLGALVYSFERLSCFEPDTRGAFRDFITIQGGITSNTPHGDKKIHCAYECDSQTFHDRHFVDYCYYLVEDKDMVPSEVGPDNFYAIPMHTINFPSIRASLWFTVVTKATVGFGDIVPETIVGKSVGGLFCMLSGILAISLPVAVLGNTFQDLAQLQDAKDGASRKLPPFRFTNRQVSGSDQASSVPPVDNTSTDPKVFDPGRDGSNPMLSIAPGQQVEEVPMSNDLYQSVLEGDGGSENAFGPDVNKSSSSEERENNAAKSGTISAKKNIGGLFPPVQQAQQQTVPPSSPGAGILKRQATAEKDEGPRKKSVAFGETSFQRLGTGGLPGLPNASSTATIGPDDPRMPQSVFGSPRKQTSSSESSENSAVVQQTSAQKIKFLARMPSVEDSAASLGLSPIEAQLRILKSLVRRASQTSLDIQGLQMRREEVKILLRIQIALLVKTLVDHYTAKRARVESRIESKLARLEEAKKDLKLPPSIQKLVLCEDAYGAIGKKSKKVLVVPGSSKEDDSGSRKDPVGKRLIGRITRYSLRYTIIPITTYILTPEVLARAEALGNMTQRMQDLIPLSLNLFPKESNFRRYCFRIVTLKVFETFIIGAILGNAALYCIQDYSTDDNWQASLLVAGEPVFLLIFVIEFLMKIVAYGFFYGKNTYLRDGWNWLDFTVVVSGLVDFVATMIMTGDDDNSFIAVLRTFRVLRPLRTLSTMPGLKALVVTVFSSLPKLGSAVALCVFINLIFSLIGMTFFGGRLNRRCRLSQSPIEILLPPTYSDELVRLWNNHITSTSGGTSNDLHGAMLELGDDTGTNKQHYPPAYKDWISPYNVSAPYFANPELHPWFNQNYEPAVGNNAHWPGYTDKVMYQTLQQFQAAVSCTTFCVNMQGFWTQDDKTQYYVKFKNYLAGNPRSGLSELVETYNSANPANLLRKLAENGFDAGVTFDSSGGMVLEEKGKKEETSSSYLQQSQQQLPSAKSRRTKKQGRTHFRSKANNAVNSRKLSHSSTRSSLPSSVKSKLKRVLTPIQQLAKLKEEKKRKLTTTITHDSSGSLLVTAAPAAYYRSATLTEEQYELAFRLFLKRIYDRYVRRTFGKQKQDFEDNLKFVVWPIDNEQSRLCGARYSCESYKSEDDMEEEDFETLRVLGEKTLTVSYSDNNQPELATSCGGSYWDDTDQGPYRKKKTDNTGWGLGVKGNVYDLPEEINLPDLQMDENSFDNIFVALLTCFATMTLEGWTITMYMVQDGVAPEGGAVFFLLLIAIGNFFLLNITLAIVLNNFLESSEQQQKKAERDELKRQEKEEDPAAAPEKKEKKKKKGDSFAAAVQAAQTKAAIESHKKAPKADRFKMFGFSVGMPPWVGASRLQKKNKNPAASPKATPYGGGSSPTAAVTQQSQLVESLIAVNLDTPQQQQVNGRSNSRDNFKNTQPRQRRRVIISTTGQRLPNQKDPLRERLKSLPTFRECCRQVDPLREQKLQKQASNPDGKQSGGASGPRALPGEKLLEDLEKQDKPTSDFLLPEQEDEDPSLATFDAEKQSEWTPPVKPKIDPHASTASGGESSPFSVGTWKRVGQKLWFANLASSPSSGEKKDGDTPPGEGEVANPMDFMSDFRDNLPHEGDLFRMIEDDKYKQARDRVDRGATMTKKERLKRKEEMDGPPISERQQEFLAESITRDKEMQRRARILRGKAKHAKQSFQVVRAAMKLTKLAGKKWGQNKRNPWVIDPDIFGPSKDERENETEITFFEDMEREEDLRLQRQREDEQERAREAAMLEEQERLEQEHSDMQSVADSSAAAKKKAKKRKTLSAKKAKTAKENELLERKDYLLRWLEKHHGNLREAKEESIQKRQIFLNYHWLARLAINFYALQSLQMFIMLVITFNVIILSLDMWPMPDRGTSILLDDMNYVCTIIFLVEFVAAHLGLGFIAYWTTPSLIFDGFIVLASVAELVTAASGGGSQLTSLRGLRLLRVFRLARKWKSLALLMWSMYRSFIQLGNFTLLLCLMIAVFALMGQTFFAATLVFDPDTGYWLEECSGVGNWSDPECVEVCPEINDCRERLNFDTFLWAVTTILVMLTGEDWPSIMFAGMKTSGLATIYFLLVVGVGSFLILNLFVAILMSSFEEQSEKNRTLVEALKMQKIEQEGVRIAKAQRKQAMAGSPSEHLKLIWNALNKREMLAISNEIASRENSKEIEDTTPQDSPQDGTTNPNSVLAKKKQQKAAPIMIRDDLNILQASFMWVSLATKRTSGAIDKRVQKLLRRVRRRFMIFKRISLGSKSFFIFPFKGIDEIMMQIEKVREADSSELKNIMKEQMMISQHEMDEMEKLPWYKKYYKKYLAWIPEMFKRAEKIEYEDDELSLGSTASSEHRSPFTKTDVSFRERMRRVMKHPKFDQVILLCIATSSLLMIVNTPLSDPRAEPENTFYFVMDWFFGIIFTAEMFTKMIAMGVLVNNNPAPEQFAELQEDLERQKLEEEERQIKAEEDRIKEEKERQKEQEKFESERAKMDKSKVASDATLAAARGQAITPIDTSGSSPRTNSRESSGSAGRKPGGYEAAIREKQAINIAVGNPNVHGSDKLGLGKVPIPHSVISDSDLQISGGSGSGRSPAAPASGSDTVVAGLKPKTVEAVVPSKNGKVVAPNAGKKKKGGGVEVDDMEAQMENAGKGDATAGEEEPPASAGSTTSSLAAILYDTEYQQPYMSDPWNMLDFIVVCVAWIELTQVLEGGSFLKVLRLFRTLRPLRMISRNPNLKLVVTTLFKSFPQLVTLCVFGGFILLLFGVFATSYLKGALSECKGEDGADPMEFYNSTCRDEFCNDQRLGFCVDTYNYDFVTYATYAEIEADDPYLHLKYSLFPNSTASAAAAPSELSLVDFRSDANYWSSNRMCYEQLRYSFFEPKSELTSTVTSTVPQNNQPAITTLQTADLLYQPDDPTSKAYQPTTYNESYWQLTYPDPAIRETRIREEIQRRYRPQLRGSKDTPLCVVNCAEVGNSHPFCVASEVKQDEQTGVWSFDQNIWGHRVIPCTSCYTNFCENTGVETESEEHCKYQCDGPSQYNLYCTDGACDDPNSAQCLTCKNECIAQCKCPQVCLPHLKDATSCILAKGRWWRVVPGMGFDNILKAAFTLFQVITTEGWVVIMLAVVDQDGIYADPIRDNIELWVIFFWIYSLVGYFFLANVVIGVIIDNFNQMKRDAEADTSEQKVLSEAQQRWVQCQKVFYATRSFFLITNVESLPAGQRGLFFFVASKKFESFIMSCIVLNIFAMAFRVHPEPTNKNTLAYDLHIVIEPINLFCLIVFNVEFILKLIAYRTGYFSDMWNKFDFSCVVSSNIGYILELLNVGDTGSLSIIRMFRIIRLFRLVRFLSGLNQLSGAFLLSIPKLGNVSAILGLVLLIFALLGMNLFSPFLMLDSFAAYGPSANFLTFWDSMLTLLRCMTGEAWNSIMADLATEQFETQSVLNQPCVQEMAITKDNFSFLNAEGYLEKPIQCGNTETAYVFFVMFIVFVFFIVLNLFIAVIFEGFEESRQLQVGNILQLAMDLWSEYDPKYELILPVDHAITFVGEVLEKSGLDTDEDSNLTLAERRVKMMRSYALQVTPAGDTHFLWCCQAILRKTIVQNSPELARQLEELDTDTSGSLMTKQVIEMREQRIAQTESTATEFVAKKKVFGLERYDARLSIDIIIRGIRKARVRLRKRKHDQWQAALLRLFTNMDGHVKKCGLLATRTMYSKTANRLRYIILQDAKVFQGIPTATVMDAVLMSYGIDRYKSLEDKTANPKLNPSALRKCQSFVGGNISLFYFYNWLDKRVDPPPDPGLRRITGPPLEGRVNARRGDSDERKVLETLDFEDPDLLLSAEQYLNRYDRFGRRRRASHDGRKSRAGGPKHDVIEVDTSERLDAGLRRGGAHSDEASSSDFYQDDKYRRRPGSDLEEEEKNRTKAAKDYLSQQKEDPASPIIPKSLIPDPVIQTTAHADVNIQDLTQPKPKAEKDKIRKERKDRQERNKRKLQFVIDNQAIHEEERRKMMLDFVEKNSLKLQREQSGEAASGSSVSLKTENAQKWVDNWREKEQERLMIEKEKLYALERQIASETAVKSPSLSQRVLEESGIGSPTSRGNLNAEQHEDGTIERASKTTELNSESTVGGGNGTMLGSSGTA